MRRNDGQRALGRRPSEETQFKLPTFLHEPRRTVHALGGVYLSGYRPLCPRITDATKFLGL